MKMSAPCFALRLVAVGILFACAPVAHSDERVTCRRDASTGQLVWLRGKSSEPLKNVAFKPGLSNPNLGTCLVGNDQLRKAHGLSF